MISKLSENGFVEEVYRLLDVIPQQGFELYIVCLWCSRRW